MKKERNNKVLLDRRTFLKVMGLTTGGAMLGGTVPVFNAALSKTKSGGDIQAALVGTVKVDSFDPPGVFEISNWQLIWGIYNSLLKFDGQMNLLPDLAKSWEMLDETTYIFHLNHGVQFHDGNELTSEDVKFSLERVMEAKGSQGRDKFLAIKDIVPKDRYTVIIKTKEIFAPLLTYLTNIRTAGQIVSKEAVQKYGEDFRFHPVGTGPFKFVGMKPGSHVTFKKFKGYFKKGLPYLDSIKFPIIPEESTGVSAILSGDVHVLSKVTPAMVRQLKPEGRKAVRILRVPGLNFRYIMLNESRPPFDDIFIRRAFAHAINRKELVEVVCSGEATESLGPIPPCIKWAYDPTLGEQTFNPEKARALLAKSKYSKKSINDMKVRVEGYGKGFWKTFAEVVCHQISQVLGVDVKPRISEFGSVYTRLEQGTYSAVTWGNRGHVDLDEYFYQHYHSKGFKNLSMHKNYSNKEADKLVEEGRKTLDLEKRAKVYKKAQKIIVKDAPDLYCFHQNEIQAVREDVNGFVQTPYAGFGAQFEQVWVG